MAVMATNVVGVGRTCRAFLPLLRESGAGRLVLIGSYFGSIAGALGAGHLYYEASKHAVEGMADNLRRSEAAHGAGVRVSLVKPGNIVTGMNPKPYGEDEPAVVVRAVRHALGPAPKRRYLAGRVKGWPVGLLCWTFTHMPSWLTDKQPHVRCHTSLLDANAVPGKQPPPGFLNAVFGCTFYPFNFDGSETRW